MTGARWLISGLLAVVFAASAGAVAGGDGDAVFPFVKGTTWAYAAKVKWTDDRTPRSTAVCWSSEVVDAFDHGDVAGALLEGGVWDLAWWSPDARPDSYVLLRVDSRYYIVRDDAKNVFAAAKRWGREGLAGVLEPIPWFGTPLKAGELFRPSDAAPREDTKYGWLVERATRAGYVLSYSTLPDEERMTLVPGVGITSYAYLHHGTVAEADVRLVGYHRGDRKVSAAFSRIRARNPSACSNLVER